MSGLQNDWYVAGPDGEAIGPLARTELVRRHAAGAFARDALAWHLEHSEWLPVSRVVGGLSSATAGPASAPPREAAGAGRGSAPAKPSRSERRPPPPAPASGDDRAAREARALRELRERLAAGSAAAGASVAAAKAAGAQAARQAKADAAQSGARLQLGLRRALARAIDVLLVGVPAAAIGWGLLTGGRPESLEGVLEAPAAPFLAWLALFVLVPLEAVMLAATGATPGKALLGLRVAAPGGKPGFGPSWARASTVVWRGVGLGIVPLTLIAVIIAGVQLVNDGETPWDRAQGLSMQSSAMDNRRWQLAFAALLGGLFLLAGGVWGELAVEVAAAVAAG